MSEEEDDVARQAAAAKPTRRACTMSYETTRFKSMAVALRELEQIIKSPVLLETGKPLKGFGDARPRELVANWMICAAANAEEEEVGERMAIHSDPVGGDGIIVDTKTGETWPTEHVLVPMPRTTSVPNIEASIAKAVSDKQKKGGAAYAMGKTLVVFLNSGGGEWKPTRVARNLPTHDFGAMWVVGLCSAKDGEYVYGVANLHLKIGHAPAWTFFHVLWGRHAPARGSIGHSELEHNGNKCRVRSDPHREKNILLGGARCRNQGRPFVLNPASVMEFPRDGPPR